MIPPMSGRGFQYDMLWQVHGPVLTRRRLLSLLRKHGFQRNGLRIVEHPRSGRNRLFIIEGLDDQSWLAKQNLILPHAEPWFYAEAAPAFEAAPACLITDPASGVVVLEYLTDASALYQQALTDAPSVLPILTDLASLLARLHSLRPPLSGLPTARIPFPELDPIDVHCWINSSPAAQEFVAGLQEQALLSEVFGEALEGRGPHGLIHGDLKLDNVLCASGRLLMVDWECCGRGALGWDLGAVIGSMIILWTDQWIRTVHRIPAQGHDDLARDDVFNAASQFMKQYLNHAETIGLVPPDRQTVITYTAAWIIGRSWSEAFLAYHPMPYHPVRLLVAEALMDDPAYLFGDLTW